MIFGDNGVVVMDGAMGTLALARRPDLTGPSALWSVDAADLVESLHREYVDAGARVVVANTFLAARAWLPPGAPSVDELNRASVELARRAAGATARVAGDVGPSGADSFDEAVDDHLEQIAALVAAGVDMLLLETMPTLGALRAALTAASAAASGVPFVASMTFDGMCRSRDGATPIDLVTLGEQFGASAIGVNCCVGPVSVLEAMRDAVAATRLPVVVRPSAGLPFVRDEKTTYPVDDAAMASWSRRFVAAGARAVGGCCGTTPETIRAIVEAVREPKRI